MEQITRLVELLSDGLPHSGVQLGESLGVSRSAIWKLIQKANEQYGLNIESIAGTGYILRSPIEWLNSEIIYANLHKPVVCLAPDKIHIYNTLASTNDQALLEASRGAPSGSVWLCEHQTAGRGRRGRSWLSPLIGNIYLSLLWRFKGGASSLEGLSLVTGIVVAQTLQSAGVKNALLKWPNDIYIEGRKVGGILIEITGDPLAECAVVVGIGINMKSTPEIESEVGQPITAINQYQANLSRNALTASLIERLVRGLETFESLGFRAFVDSWSKLDYLYNKLATVSGATGSVCGTCKGVTERGALILDVAGVDEYIYAGEVSVRPA